MIKRLSVCALMCLLFASRTGISQTNPWNGSWKIEPSTLKYAGPTFSVVTDTDGFTTTRGGQAQPKVVCDGKPQKSPDAMMVTCTKSATGYELAGSKDGKPQFKTTISVSGDSKTRTTKSQIYPSDAAPFTRTVISERVSGGPGPAGEWREIKFSSSDDKGILTIAVNGDSVDFKETDSPKPITCKLDGTETKFGDRGSMSVKLADPHTLHVTYKDNDGKVRRENTFALNADSKSITETDITSAPSVSKMTVVLRKM
jgi:hypothetical protein